jgi:subtilase family serine protease
LLLYRECTSIAPASQEGACSESSGETTYDSSYNHSGIAVTASSGDGGYGVEYPAASPYVVAVGGTTLNLTSSNTYSSESAWSSAGRGCSAYETANSWQTAVSDWSQTGCGTKRGVADVSADADPNTGAAVYDSTRYQGQSDWFQVGGTSLSSPLIAGVFALAGGASSYANAQQIPYTRFTNGMFKQDFRPLLDSAEQKWDRRRYSRSRSSATWNSFHLVSAKR